MFPFFRVFGRVIGLYGICVVLGVFLAGFLAIRKCKQRGLPSEDIFILGAFAIGFAIAFGNVLYLIVTYSADEIWQMIKAFDFSFVGSGIVFYGGLIGGMIGAFLGAHIAKCDKSALLRVVVPYVPLGHAIGRIGCLMAGCCYGMAYSGPFAVYYPRSLLGVPADRGCFPVQPLEAILNVGIAALLLNLEKKEKDGYVVLFFYLGMYSICRFLLEFLRGDLHRGIYSGISLSQWISLGLLVVSLVGLWTRKKKNANNKETA